MRLDDKLSSYAVDFTFDDLPNDVIDRAKWCILDFFGAAVAGSQAHNCKLLISLMKKMGGVPESTVIVDGSKLPSPNAAFANASAAHALELDDGHYASVTHPGTVVIPASLAIAEAIRAQGEELIASIAAGYETMICIGKLIQPSHVYRGFHPTGTCGTLGAAAAVANLLKFNKPKVKNALRIAALQSSGLLEVSRTGGSMKPLNAARAAQGGIYSALLAEKGAIGPAGAIDGGAGFLHAFSDNENFDLRDKTPDDYQIRRVYFKFYAACRNIHPAIEAALDVVRDQSMRPSEIKEIVVVTQSYNAKSFGEIKTSDPASARFSIPYAVAAAVFLGNGWIEAFSEASLRNPSILNLAKKVRIRTSSSFDKKYPYPSFRASKVRIETLEGRRIEKTMELVKGDPGKISKPDLELKFEQLSAGLLTREKVKKIITEIDELEKLKDITTLVKLIRAG